MTRPAGSFRRALALVLSATAGCGHSSAIPAKSGAQAIRLTVEQVRYDGFRLSGRLRLEATADVTLYRRLGFEVVRIHDVVACGMRQSLKTLEEAVDYAWGEGSPTDFISFRKGEWFGLEMAFLLFPPKLGSPGGPHCIEFTIDVALSGDPFSGWAASWRGEATVNAPAP